MALNRPTYRVNVAANKKATEKKSVFFDIKPDTTNRLRVLPPVTEDGLLFTLVSNHFKLKSDEGFGMALACLHEHGTADTGEDCYLCELVNYLRKGDKADQKVARDLAASKRWYMQCLVYDKASESYGSPKLVGLSRTTAEAVQDILNSQADVGDDFFCDPDKGQDLIITRKGSGMQTRYTVAPTGKKASLDDTFPGWEEKIMTDVLKVIDLRIHDVDDQKKAAYRSFGDALDWEAIQEAIG